MSQPWPNNWVKLTCPNGHELTEYERVEDTIDFRQQRVFGFCPICREPWVYQGVFEVGEFDTPRRVPIPLDGGRGSDPTGMADLPPFSPTKPDA